MYAAARQPGESPDWEKEYMPSLNTTRFQEHESPSDKVIEHFLAVARRETQRVRSKYRVRENIDYGKVGHDNQLLDIYFKDAENDSPIFAFIHGGYWQELDKSTAGSFVAPLVERGHRVVVADYNLCPRVTLEQLVRQMHDFFEWIFRYAAETNASSIAFCGHSAGAHLASTLLNWPGFLQQPHADRTRAFFCISGVYDLRELWSLECANPGNILSLDRDKAEQLSPMLWDVKKEVVDFANSHDMKFHVLVGENESPTFKGQSRSFHERLKGLGLRSELKVFERYDHFDIVEEAEDADSPICRYILQHIQ